MKQFKLIKTYPGSPPINTIIEEAFENSILYKCIKPPVYLAKENVENYPEYWEKVQEISEDYEILSFRCITKGAPGFGKLLNLQEDGNYNWEDRQFTDFSLKSVLSAVNDGHQEVYSVKRLSDGKVFTIGDRIKYADYNFNNVGCLVNNFSIKNDKIYINHHYRSLENLKTINDWIKFQVKKPLFTTEDGVDIFENDKYYWINSLGKDVCFKDNANSTSGKRSVKYFSTEKKAREYLDSLKPKVVESEVYEKEYEILSFQQREIHSIKRLSDGQIFTVGDKVYYKTEDGLRILCFKHLPFNQIKIVLDNSYTYSVENLKVYKEPVKTEPKISHKIVSFGPNPSTGGIYTFNKHTDKYHSDISQAEIPYKKCFRYPVRSVTNTEKNFFKRGDCVNRLDTKSNTKYDIIYFEPVKKKKIIYAHISTKNTRARLIKINIDNLEHFVE